MDHLLRSIQRLARALCALTVFASLGLATNAGLAAESPDVFLPIKGGWGRMGMTHIRLDEASERQMTDALHTAWRLRVDMNEKGSSRSKKPAKKEGDEKAQARLIRLVIAQLEQAGSRAPNNEYNLPAVILDANTVRIDGDVFGRVETEDSDGGLLSGFGIDRIGNSLISILRK